MLKQERQFRQKKIGVVQLVEHDALDASYKGFKDGLEKAGYKDGDKIKIEYKNAQNEQSNCQTIAKQFVTDKCDLVLAIATPAAQAMANESKRYSDFSNSCYRSSRCQTVKIK